MEGMRGYRGGGSCRMIPASSQNSCRRCPSCARSVAEIILRLVWKRLCVGEMGGCAPSLVEECLSTGCSSKTESWLAGMATTSCLCAAAALLDLVAMPLHASTPLQDGALEGGAVRLIANTRY